MLTQTQFDKLKAGGHLPSPNAAAARVIELTGQEDASIQEIAHLIKSDPAMSARIIKAANTKMEYLSRPIVSITEALPVLGFNIVRQLVLGLSLIDGNRQGPCPQFNYQHFWAHSLLTAIATQNLVLLDGKGSAEELFILGLLGQIGALALASLYPKEYADVLARRAANEETKLVRLERAEFGFDHNQLTQAMLADWKMPKIFQEIILHHEEPELAPLTEGSRSRHLLNTLHIAGLFSRLCLSSEAQRRNAAPTLILTASRLVIELDTLIGLADKTAREWQEWSALCGIRFEQLPPFADLLTSAALEPDTHANGEVAPSSIKTSFKLRILLADDDRAILLLVKKLLTNDGHTVVTAGNGAEALAMIAEFAPQVIITDWIMPVMDGIDFCKLLRQNPAWQNIYVFILTAQEGVDRLVEAFEAGVNDYITKPISPRLMLARLSAAQRMVQLQEEVESDHRQLKKIADELQANNQRLRKSETCMRAILENSPYMAWLKDTEGRYIMVNKAFVRHARQKNEQHIIGRTDFNFWPKKLAEKYRSQDSEVMARRKQTRYEESLQTDGGTLWLEVFKTPVVSDNGKVIGATGFARDISERKEAEEQIRNLAFYDPLTQLPNRRLLNDRLGQSMSATKRSGRYGALMFLDMDNFKPLNDQYGHVAGDFLLIEVARRIHACVRETDTVARFGGDEFVVMLGELAENKAESAQKAGDIAEKIRAALAETYRLNIQEEGKAEIAIEHHCTSSIGVVLFSGRDESQKDILKTADMAMYEAKAAGRNRVLLKI